MAPREEGRLREEATAAAAVPVRPPGLLRMRPCGKGTEGTGGARWGQSLNTRVAQCGAGSTTDGSAALGSFWQLCMSNLTQSPAPTSAGA